MPPKRQPEIPVEQLKNAKNQKVETKEESKSKPQQLQAK